MTKYKLRGKKAVMAMNNSRTMIATKEGKTWKGTIQINGPISEHRLINYTNSTLECELAAFTWDDIEIE